MSQDINLFSDLDILPELKELDRFLYELLPDENINSLDFIEDVLKGNWVLEPLLFWKYISQVITNVIYDWKHLFVSILVLFILSSVVGGILEAFKNDGAAKAAKLFFVVCQLAVLINAFKEVLDIVGSAMDRMLEFLKLMIPTYMICMAAAGSGMSALIFYKLLLGFICLIEGIVAASLTSVVEGYVMLGVAESIWGEERFKPIMELIRKSLQWALKTIVMVLSGSSILQVIITPVIDRANNAVIYKTAGAIPGIGDMVESVSSVTLASAIALKNSLGVLILVILVLTIITPVIHSFVILITIRIAGALGSICGEKQMTKCVDYISEAGFMLIRILITVTTLFFVTIAAVTNATSGGM
jgi:stage III sporulation protein AE